MASLYKRGTIFWIKYYRPGVRKPIRQSLETESDAEAKRLKKILEGKLAEGNAVDLRVNRIRFGHLLDLVIADYTNNSRRSLDTLKSRIEGSKGDGGHIRPTFGDRRAITINAADIALYVERRLAEGAKPATVNRELLVIKKAFTLAWRAYRMPGPHIGLLQENNIREGFVDRSQLEMLCRHLPEFLVPVARFAYLTGWRLGEIRHLEWRHVDFIASEIRLDATMTKTKKSRVIKMTPELRDLLKSIERVPLQPRVFLFRRWKHSNPTPIGQHKRSWASACRRAGLPGRIFHDLRRSAVRQFVRDGIGERIAMSMTGHKTRAVFDRYNIVSEQDLIEAARKTEDAARRHKKTS